MAAMKPHGLHTPKMTASAKKGSPVRDELASWFAGAMFLTGVTFWGIYLGVTGGWIAGLFCAACIVWGWPGLIVDSIIRYYGSE